MLKIITCDKSNYEKKLFSYVNNVSMNNKKRSAIVSNIIKKISIGKINKFKEENSLLSQQWVMDPKKKVWDILKELNLGSIEIKEFYRVKIGE